MMKMGPLQGGVVVMQPLSGFMAFSMATQGRTEGE
jgi:hypothetical protein